MAVILPIYDFNTNQSLNQSINQSTNQSYKKKRPFSKSDLPVIERSTKNRFMPFLELYGGKTTMR